MMSTRRFQDKDGLSRFRHRKALDGLSKPDGASVAVDASYTKGNCRTCMPYGFCIYATYQHRLLP